MRAVNKFIIFGAVCFAACASPPPAKSHREILQASVDMQARLDIQAAVLQKAGGALCEQAVGNDGVISHSAPDYPELFRSVASSLWNLDAQKRVLYVRLDSEAEQHGLKFGDSVDVALLAKFASNNTDCSYDARVRIDVRPNAYANGETIFVTTGLLEIINDLPLSLVIAHEMAHNVLEHVGQDISTTYEQDADRWALFLLARAGLNFEAAISDPVSARAPHGPLKLIQKEQLRREEHFKKVVAEIKSLQKEHLPLNP